MTGKPAKCPSCGKTATGNFCQHCGSQLGGRFCNQCGAQVGGGAAFCNQCGAEVAAAPGRKGTAAAAVGGANLPWWIAGVAMFAVIVVLGVSMVRPGPGGTSTPAPVAPFAGGGAGAPPDLSQWTPREQADRLFNRVMQAASSGDQAGAQAFLPMALSAYELAEPLDHDGLFHLSLLQTTAGDLTGALATAERVLGEDPDHLLALSAAAQAEAALGRRDAAAEHYRHFLDVYDQQIARGLEEYDVHENMMGPLRSEATAFLGG